jgi:hypothetical protein
MRKIYAAFLRGCFCLCCSLFVCRPLSAQVQTPRYVSITSNTNGYYEYLPAGYSSGSGTYPLLIFLAGEGELGNGNTDLPLMLHNGPPMLISQGQFPSSFTVNGQTFSFIILSPQFVSMAQASDLDAIIAYAKANYRVDATRIYITGLSLGGSTLWNYVANVGPANELAGIVPIAGGQIYESYGPLVIASADLPVFATANLNDPTVPSSYTVDDVNNINAITPHINPTAQDVIFNASGHGGWTQTYDPTSNMTNGLNIYQWMLQYSRVNGSITQPLPIKLVSFTAELLSGTPEVQLAWSTSYEQNNHYFLVERSADGQNFSVIDTVAATNIETGSAYSYTDPHPRNGANFYRLDQVDFDGTATYSGIKEVTIAGAANGLQLSPNPADGVVYLSLDGNVSGSLQVRLLDVQGRTLRSWVFEKPEGAWDQSLDVSGLPAGSYFMQVLGTNYQEIKTFIKK